MGAVTHIQWTDHTFNPWEGCTKVSPGCAHCYAEARDIRFTGGKHWGKGAPRRRTSVHNWNEPRRWNAKAGLFLQCAQGCRFQSTEAGLEGFCPKCGDPQADTVRPRVFCASLADWLDDEVPIEWIADLLTLIQDTPNLNWQLLTKRPENWRTAMYAIGLLARPVSAFAKEWLLGNAPANVWIGTTVEDQTRADERIPHLLEIPAKVRFLSCEPLLEEIFIECFMRGILPDGPVNWVICGGESGKDARPMHPHWARSLRDQCAASNVPFFFKQWGEWLPGRDVADVPDHEPKKIVRLALDGTQANEVTMPAEKRHGMKCMCLVGKSIAGRRLDGIEHSAFPS